MRPNENGVGTEPVRKGSDSVPHVTTRHSTTRQGIGDFTSLVTKPPTSDKSCSSTFGDAREKCGSPMGQAMSDDEMRARAEYAENPLRYANEASDYGWSVITGMCGGCGSEECHDGTCDGEHCRRCPHRRDQGFPSLLGPPVLRPASMNPGSTVPSPSATGTQR